jgi:hypothetical protein
VIPTYVYGVVAADTALPEGLRGLGPSGTVSLMTDGQIAAVVGDVPVDRPLATRDDLMTHESVVDAIAARGRSCRCGSPRSSMKRVWWTSSSVRTRSISFVRWSIWRAASSTR